jgi:hypothetical protein
VHDRLEEVAQDDGPPIEPPPAPLPPEDVVRLAAVDRLRREAIDELSMVRMDADQDPDRAVLDAWRALDRFMNALSVFMKSPSEQPPSGSTGHGLDFLWCEDQLRDAVLGLGTCATRWHTDGRPGSTAARP